MERARVFNSGNSQAVRLPKAFRLQGGYVWLRRVGSAVLLIPDDDAWDRVDEAMERFTDDVFAERVQPEQPERGSVFP